MAQEHVVLSDNNVSAPAKYHRGNWSPYQPRPSGKPGLLPSPVYTWAPNPTPPGMCQRRLNGDPGLSLFLGSTEHPHARHQWRPRRKLALVLSPGHRRVPLPRPSPFLLISTEAQWRVRARSPLRSVGGGHTGSRNEPSFPYPTRAVSVQSSRDPHVCQAATGTSRSSAHAGHPRRPRGEPGFAAVPDGNEVAHFPSSSRAGSEKAS